MTGRRPHHTCLIQNYHAAFLLGLVERPSPHDPIYHDPFFLVLRVYLGSPGS